MTDKFKDKSFLVVGGTGSFGNQVIQHLVNRNVKEIRVLSRDEKKQDDMRKLYRMGNLKFYIGDVRDRSSLTNAIKGTDYIFHAAALKQVPSCEFYPIEAVKTNVVGTHNVLRSAQRHGVERVVVLSTDKAVYPINAMGISKALMEKVAVAESRNSENVTSIMATRYGNVIASRGSAIPLFIKQIKSGGPITLTEPNMTRFLMSLDRAVDLVFHAFDNGQNGDIFVQKAPAATVETIAYALMKLVGKEVPIKVIGRRHGEKAHESLVSSEELAVALESEEYYRIPRDHRSTNYSLEQKLDADFNNTEEPYASSNTRILDIQETLELLQSTPEVRDLI
jgi:UDP-glucose 4-epimerase